MRFLFKCYRLIISKLDELTEKEQDEQNNKSVAPVQNYVFASVFPDPETMNAALDTIKILKNEN